MVSTRDKVKQLRLADPLLRATNIAKQIGVSRERVRQILKGSNLPTSFSLSKPKLYCIKCGKITFSKNPREQLCLTCYSQCHNVSLECFQCHSSFKRLMSTIKYTSTNPRYTNKHTFCSRECFYLFRRNNGPVFGKTRINDQIIINLHRHKHHVGKVAKVVTIREKFYITLCECNKILVLQTTSFQKLDRDSLGNC